jgi:phosphoribosylglycinamide formyltransferase 1
MNARAPLKPAILISGRGSNMTAIVRACQAGTLTAEPLLVVSDQEKAQGLGTARELGVPTATLGRPFEPELASMLDALNPDAIVLAGFMRILSTPFVERHLGRLLNIHPSLLPAYRGLHTHRRVLEAGDRVHGASVHFVTPELDAGPVVLQSKVAVRPDDTEATLSARVQSTEHIIYPKVLGWLAEQRLAWRAGAAWLDGAPLSEPLVEDFRAASHG